MPQFRVGDRVKCISNDNVPRLVVGEEYTITQIEEPFVSIDEEVPNLYSRRFRLVEAAQPVAPVRPGTVFYTVIFEQVRNDGFGVRGFETEDALNNFIADIGQRRIICKKKLTLTLPNREA